MFLLYSRTSSIPTRKEQCMVPGTFEGDRTLLTEVESGIWNRTGPYNDRGPYLGNSRWAAIMMAI